MKLGPETIGCHLSSNANRNEVRKGSIELIFLLIFLSTDC